MASPVAKTFAELSGWQLKLYLHDDGDVNCTCCGTAQPTTDIAALVRAEPEDDFEALCFDCYYQMLRWAAEAQSCKA